MNTKEETEQRTILALSRGDIKAYDKLFLEYQPKLLYFISGFIKDSELARDMAQDIFLKIWTSRESLSQIISFKSYLFRMAKNAIHNHFDHALVSEKFQIEQLSLPINTEDPEDEYFAQELQTLIDIVVTQMPPQRKLIYRLSRIEGIDNEEIAKELNITKRTVENQLSLALKDIRKIIQLSILFLS